MVYTLLVSIHRHCSLCFILTAVTAQTLLITLLQHIIQYNIQTFMRNILHINNKDLFIYDGFFLELREGLNIRLKISALLSHHTHTTRQGTTGTAVFTCHYHHVIITPSLQYSCVYLNYNNKDSLPKQLCQNWAFWRTSHVPSPAPLLTLALL